MPFNEWLCWPDVLNCSGPPCLIGLAQQAVDTLPLVDLGDYKKVRATVLQTSTSTQALPKEAAQNRIQAELPSPADCPADSGHLFKVAQP